MATESKNEKGGLEKKSHMGTPGEKSCQQIAFKQGLDPTTSEEETKVWGKGKQVSTHQLEGPVI